MDEEIISMGRKVKSPLLNRKREQLSLGDRSLWVTPTEEEPHKSEVAMPNVLIHTGVANMSALCVPSPVQTGYFCSHLQRLETRPLTPFFIS